MLVEGDATRWLNAAELTVGATMRDVAGEVGVVEARVVVDAPSVMYNLTIECVATYIVGTGQWVVHNQDWGPYPLTEEHLEGLFNIQPLQLPDGRSTTSISGSTVQLRNSIFRVDFGTVVATFPNPLKVPRVLQNVAHAAGANQLQVIANSVINPKLVKLLQNERLLARLGFSY